jgi:hypothetical protein
MLCIRTQAHRHPRIYTHIYIYVYAYTYTRIYTYLAILIISENYTKANESIVGWLNGLLVSMHNYMLRIY